MAANTGDKSDGLTLKNSSAPKRLHKETDLSDSEDDLNQTPFGHDRSNSSFSKKSKTYSYREQTLESLESLDGNKFKSAFESAGLCDSSIDSGTWFNASNSFSVTSPPSASKSASITSLELNSIIQKYDDATLNSLSMSQMSAFSEDAVSSPFPPTLEMGSQSSRDESMISFDMSSQKTTLTSLSCSQTSVMSFCENAMTSPIRQTVDMTPLLSQPSAEIPTELSDTPSQEKRKGSDLFEDVSSADEGEKAKDDSTHLSSVFDSSFTSRIGVEANLLAVVSNRQSIHSLRKEEPSPHIMGSNEGNLETSAKIISQDQEKLQLCTQNIKIKGFQSNGDEKKKADQIINIVQNTVTSGFEREIIVESNAELKEKFKSCKKNPGHEKFFSPKELKVTNLPPDIQHEDSVTFFQCLSNLVVQISVAFTSDKRCPDDSYSCYIGSNKVRDGSGFIASTDKHVTKMKCNRKDCPEHRRDSESSVSLEPSTSAFDRSVSNMSTSSTMSGGSTDSYSGQAKKHYIYGGVYVRTNKHVIYDKSEADSACVNFFFNSSDKKGVVRGHVASITGVNDEQDHIILHVMSHDIQLLDVIDVHLKNAKSSYVQMIKSTHYSQQNYGRNKLCWVAVISHPHGTASSISFGRLKKEDVEQKRVIKYYDADTCPGSSGGLVITPSLLHLQWPGAVHSSYCQKTKYNVSLDSRCQELDATLIAQMNKNILNKE